MRQRSLDDQRARRYVLIVFEHAPQTLMMALPPGPVDVL
jgi:hypothetical protein